MMRRIALIAVALALASCDNRPRQWDAVVYPDADNLQRYIRVNGFKSFELCQQGAIDILRSQPDPDAGDYECGYMCGEDPDYPGSNACKETRS